MGWAGSGVLEKLDAHFILLPQGPTGAVLGPLGGRGRLMLLLHPAEPLPSVESKALCSDPCSATQGKLLSSPWDFQEE